MSSITYDNKGAGDSFTAGDANEIKTAVNDNDTRIDAIEAISGLLKIVSGSPSAAVAWDDYIPAEYNILTPTDQTWQGLTADAVAGEAMTAADQWRPLCRKDTGSGTRYYFYDPDSTNSDNDTYYPVGLLVTGDTIAAGDSIIITKGDGVLANDDWTAVAGDVGTDLFCITGGVSFTPPSGSGDVVIKIGTCENVVGQSVFEISFKFPAWVL